MTLQNIPLNQAVTHITAHLAWSRQPLTVSIESSSPAPARGIHPPAVPESSAPVVSSSTAVTPNADHTRVLETLETIEMMVQEIAVARQQSLGEIQQLTVRLAVKIARAVMLQDLPEDTQRIERLTEMAMGYLSESAEATIRVHPKIHASLEHEHSGVLRRDSLRFVADDTVAIGDCRVEGDAFTLFAGVDDKLKQIEKKLLEGLSDAQIERRTSGTSDRKLQRFPDRRNLA
jgi:hypothetical protein